MTKSYPGTAWQPLYFSTKRIFGGAGIYDFGYRFYAPHMGRWMNRDPLGEAGGLNLYGYVGNSPIGFVDPDGQDFYDYDTLGEILFGFALNKFILDPLLEPCISSDYGIRIIEAGIVGATIGALAGGAIGGSVGLVGVPIVGAVPAGAAGAAVGGMLGGAHAMLAETIKIIIIIEVKKATHDLLCDEDAPCKRKH